MAVITYKINGQANTKPFKDTEQASEGMFKKIEAIDNKLKAFVGVKVFQEVNKVIKESLQEYDKFKKSLEGELNISKQFDSLKKSFSATIGTIRDELFNTLNNVFGDNSMFNGLKDLIPKIGASLIASMKVVEKIVNNIKLNFDQIIKKETWSNFFDHAKNLANSFCTYFALLLKDVFQYGITFFKWSFENLNLFSLLWTPARMFFSKMVDALRAVGSNVAPWIDEAISGGNEKAKAAASSIPGFNISGDTSRALNALTDSIADTFNSFLDTLTGTNTRELYNSEYQKALTNLHTTIKAMESGIEDNTKELKDLLDVYKKGKLGLIKDSFSDASKGFNASVSNINGILGNADSRGIQNIREKMKLLNEQFEVSSKNIDTLTEQLKAAKTIEQIDSIFDSINKNINNITDFTSSMNNLEKESLRAKSAFDLMEGALKALGDLGAVVEALMTKNWIGLLITLIAKLASTFSNISENAAAAQNILSVLFDTIEYIISDLGEALDNIFKPLLDVTSALGNVIGIILRLVINLLTPLANIINQFNFLVPILNMVSLVVGGLSDALAYLFNFISDIIKTITFDLINLGHMNTQNYQKALDAISQENSYSDYQNNSTSYNVSGDMYINIYFEHSFVNGDARNIALALRDEIRLAEKNGY
jgi:hypothetical protein